MQLKIKEGLNVMFGKSVKSINKAYPNLGAALPLVFGKKFSLTIAGTEAYNNKIFYSATNILVNKLTEAPIMFSKKKSTGSEAKFNKFYSKSTSNEKRVLIKAVNLEEVENHELNKLFDNPNTYQSGIEMMQSFWHNYTLGDGYLYFEPLGDLSRNKKPVFAHALARNRVDPIQSTNDYDNISHYIYTAWNGKQIRIEKEYMLHLKHWNPNIASLKGLGVDEVAALDINLSNQNNIAQGAAFTNGGRGTMFSSDILMDNQGEVTEKMTAEQMTVLRDSHERLFAGAENNRRQYWTNGYVNATNFGDTLAEMELIKSEDSSWKNIFTIVGVPWALSPAASSVSENSIIVGFKSLVTNTAIPEIRKFDQKLNQKVQQWWPEIVSCHDLTEFSELAPDLKLMKEVYGQPLLTINEQRSVFGWDDIQGVNGKQILVNSGMLSLDDVLAGDMETDPNADAL